MYNRKVNVFPCSLYSHLLICSRLPRLSLSVSQVWLCSLQTLQSLQASPVWPVLSCHHSLSSWRQWQDDLLLRALSEWRSQRGWHQVEILTSLWHFDWKDILLCSCKNCFMFGWVMVQSINFWARTLLESEDQQIFLSCLLFSSGKEAEEISII